MSLLLRRLLVPALGLMLLSAPLATHAQEAPAAAAATPVTAAPTGTVAEDAEGRPKMAAEDSDKLNPYVQQGIVKGYAKPWQLGYQEAASPVFQTLHNIHTGLLVMCFAISIFVMGLLFYVCTRFSEKNNPVPSRVTHNTLIEVIWTVVPILILVAIAIPSLRAHYFMTKVEDPQLTLKVTGNQWYWSYEYLDKDGNSLVAFDSHIIPANEIDPSKGQIRLLSVDNPLVFPKNATVRVLMTGADVIHSWAMPAMGVKTDAVPGRMNETWFRPEKEGIYYGQCSEICGPLHGFMPIEMHVVEPGVFQQWVTNAKAGNFAMNGLQVAAAPVKIEPKAAPKPQADAKTKSKPQAAAKTKQATLASAR